jgi:hypothetical protein
MNAATTNSGAPQRARMPDVSEGTDRDPLLRKGWDLNSSQTIPADMH